MRGDQQPERQRRKEDRRGNPGARFAAGTGQSPAAQLRKPAAVGAAGPAGGRREGTSRSAVHPQVVHAPCCEPRRRRRPQQSLLTQSAELLLLLPVLSCERAERSRAQRRGERSGPADGREPLARLVDAGDRTHQRNDVRLIPAVRVAVCELSALLGCPREEEADDLLPDPRTSDETEWKFLFTSALR